ncbi:MAG: polyprenyl synthetase family protein [Actinomycetota bacterium]
MPLLDEVTRAVASGGKRLRPVLCYWAFRGGGGRHCPEILAAAGSLELLHTFALLHDDLMDRATVRRGKPAAHLRLATELSAAGRADAEHLGLSIAMLAGDLALVLSDAMFTSSGFGPEAVTRAFVPLNELRIRTAAGQYLDVIMAGTSFSDVDAALQIARLKTASYTVEGPLLVGAALAGASALTAEALGRAGSSLGEAYQLRDDVSGVFAAPAETGKNGVSDLRQGKPTLLLAEAYARAAPNERKLLHRTVGHAAAGEDDLDRVKAVIRATGALAAVRARIDALVAAAREALSSAALADPAAAALTAIVAGLTTGSLPG